MIRRMRFYQTIAVVFSDMTLTVAAFLAAYWLRFVYQLRPVEDRPEDLLGLAGYLPALLVILPLWLLVFWAFGLYRMRRTAARAEQYVQVSIATTLAMALLAAGTFLYRPEDVTEYSRLMFVMFYLIDVVLVIFGRAAIHSATAGARST